MIDYYLKFPDEQTAQGALYDADGKPLYDSIDVIGQIRKPLDVTGEITTYMDVIGWHVNVRHSSEVAELKSWAIDPAPGTPSRVWA
jgi:hypothetical protein